jgi:hypothetical protein
VLRKAEFKKSETHTLSLSFPVASLTCLTQTITPPKTKPKLRGARLLHFLKQGHSLKQNAFAYV